MKNNIINILSVLLLSLVSVSCNIKKTKAEEYNLDNFIKRFQANYNYDEVAKNLVKSKLDSLCKDTTLPAIATANLILEFKGEEVKQEIKEEKATFIIDKDTDEVYDCCYKNYETKDISYTRYSGANTIIITHKENRYIASTIDGACDMPIRNIITKIKEDGEYEVITLYANDEVGFVKLEKEGKLDSWNFDEPYLVMKEGSQIEFRVKVK